MTFDEFQNADRDPVDLTPSLRALWCDGAGCWEEAHRLVQDDPSAAAAWVHAYLHRKEGDVSNAGYWYSRAEKPPFSGTLESEWEQIARSLLES